MSATLENPPSAVQPVGPYSQVARIDLGTGTLLILSGQIAVDDEGELVGRGSMTAQAERIVEIVRDLLAAYGGTLDDVVHIRTFLTDMDLLPEYGAVRRRHWPAPEEAPPGRKGVVPTSTTVTAPRLFREGALLEVEVTAFVP